MAVDTNTIGAISALLVGVIGAGAAAYALITRARREVFSLDRAELRATQEGWLWAVRALARARRFMAANDLTEPEEWKIDETLAMHEERIAKPGGAKK